MFTPNNIFLIYLVMKAAHSNVFTKGVRVETTIFINTPQITSKELKPGISIN